MKITETPIQGVLIIEPKIYSDQRGSFFESFNENILKNVGINESFVQDNQSVSKKSVIRGLHFQHPPYAQGKLVRVLKGSVLDVIVDIRKESKTYGRHLALEINDRNNLQIWIPAGLAHGFSVLEDDSVFFYKVTNYYNPLSESGIVYNDISLNIDWKVKDPIVSEKDLVLPTFKEYSLSLD